MRKNVIALMLVLPLLFVFVVFSAGQIGSNNADPNVTAIIIHYPETPATGTRTHTVDLLEYDNDAPYIIDVEVLPLIAPQECTISIEKEDGTPYTGEGTDIAPVRAEKVEGKNAFRILTNNTVGLAVIRAVSLDGSKSDSFKFNVIATRAYDYDVVVQAAEGEDAPNLVAREAAEGTDTPLYRGVVEPGTYTYGANMHPAGTSFVIPRISNVSAGVIVDEAKSEIRLPYAGAKVSFDLSVNGLPEENIVKHVELDVDYGGKPAPTAMPVLVNCEGVAEDGVVNHSVAQESDSITASTTVYLQTWFGDVTEFEPSDGVQVVPTPIEVAPVGDGSEGYRNYELAVTFLDTGRYTDPTLTVHFRWNTRAEETGTVTIRFEFTNFSFRLRANTGSSSQIFDNDDNNSELPMQALLLETEMSFAAMPDVPLDGIHYRWDLLTENYAPIDPADYPEGALPLGLTMSEDTAICNVRAVSKIRVILRVQAILGEGEGERSLATVRVIVDVMENILSLELAESALSAQVARSDGKVVTVAGYHYENRDGTLTVVPESAYTIDIRAAKPNAEGSTGGSINTDHSIDVRSLVFGTITIKRDGETTTYDDADLLLRHEGLGLSFANVLDPETNRVKQQLTIEMHNTWRPAEVTIPVEWAGNVSFDRKIRASVTLNLIKNAVMVQSSDQLFDATENRTNYAIVLGANIMLGNAANGSVLPVSELQAILERHKMYSTYNTQFYRNSNAAASAYVYYVLEFKQSVYGNGFFINAENFTNAKDSASQSRFFKGPIDFVRYAGLASVAGQDNIAFLCRTDGVTIYNTILLGCNDSSLTNADGLYDLNNLNKVGTTLEINADVNLINCQVRNGRNVVRAYGGNRDAQESFAGYFIGSLANRRNYSDNLRIHVRIDGCTLSYAREFILKIGSNVALIADGVSEPELLDASDRAYPSNDPTSLLDDDYFYHTYVTTDVTVKDSVLEASGLFTVGVECNFAGLILAKNAGFDELLESFEGAKAWPGTGGTSFASMLRLEGDVRLYDWKDLTRIDSSTLISVTENAGELGDWLKLDIGGMLQVVQQANPEYASIIDEENHVHGGIAFYGGGRNYSQIDFSGLAESRSDLDQYRINISILTESSDTTMQRQGQLLPLAAGTQDFNFFMYDRNSANSYESQTGASADRSVKSVSAF